MAKKNEDVQEIVLARLVEDQRIKKLGQVDIGRPHIWESFLHPEAVMWLNKGTAADVEKAKAYASRDGYTVFIYPVTEKDPLGRAKREIQG
jgi:hypothetical protein